MIKVPATPIVDEMIMLAMATKESIVRLRVQGAPNTYKRSPENKVRYKKTTANVVETFFGAAR